LVDRNAYLRGNPLQVCQANRKFRREEEAGRTEINAASVTDDSVSQPIVARIDLSEKLGKQFQPSDRHRRSGDNPKTVW
jgi:hypothetical protein